MTIEQLKDQARATLEFGVDCLRQQGDLQQTFFLMKREGGVEMVGVDAAITNSEHAKGTLSETLKARIAAASTTNEPIEAVLMLSDVYLTEMTPEENSVRAKLNMTVSELTKMGYVRKREAVYVALESPIYKMGMRQEYVRKGSGKNVEIELVGTPETLEDTEGDKLRGRFTGYFEQQRTRAVGSETHQ